MAENISWQHFFNNVGGINNRSTILKTPPVDALAQNNIDLVEGGFKKSNGIARYVEQPLLASGKSYDGVSVYTSATPAWTGAGASDGTFASSGGVGTITEDDSGAVNSIHYIAEAGFTTGTDCIYEIRCSVDDGATPSGVYVCSFCVLDDATNRFELVAIRQGAGTVLDPYVRSIALLTTTADRTVIGSYSNVTTHDWRNMTRYRVSYDASGEVSVYIDDMTAASFTATVSGLPASTETSRVAHGSYESSTTVVYNVDYICYEVGQTELQTLAINGVFDFQKEDGTHVYLAVAGTGLYEYNATTSNFDAVTGGTAFTSGAIPSFAVGRESSSNAAICIITTQDRDTPQKYDGSTRSDLGGSPPSGKYVAVFNDRTFIMNTSSAPTGVYFSAIGDSEDRDDGAGTWDTTNDVFLLDRFVYGEITGSAVIGGAQDQANMMLIFLERGIKRLTGWGKGSYQVETVSSRHGCVAPQSIMVGPLGPSQNEGVYFRDTDGWKWTNGQIGNVIKVAEKVLPDVVDVLNTSKANLDVGFVDPQRRLVGWSTTLADSSNPDTTYAFDYFNGARPGEDGKILESWGNYDYAMRSAGLFYEASGRDRMVYGTANGIVYKTDTGTNWDLADYTGTRTTAWIHAGTPEYAKQWRYLTLFLQTVGDFDLQIEWGLDWADSFTGSTTLNLAGGSTGILGTTFVLGTSVLGSAGAIKKRIALDSVGNAIRFKFYTASKAQNFVLYGFSVGYQQRDWMDSNA